MTRNRILAATGAAVVAGALFVGGVTWVGAQTVGMPWAGMHAGGFAGMQHPAGVNHDAMMAQHAAGPDHGAMMAQHPEMLAAAAKALGITTEELQAEITAGKTVPQIAEEKGISLDALHAALAAEHQANPGLHRGMGGRFQGSGS